MGTSNECQPSRNSGGSRLNRGRLSAWVECGHKNTLDEIWQKEVSARTPSMGHQVLFSIKLDSIFGFFISVLEGVSLESHLSARVRYPISRLLSDFLPFRSVSLLLAPLHHVLLKLDPFHYSGPNWPCQRMMLPQDRFLSLRQSQSVLLGFLQEVSGDIHHRMTV